MPNFFGSLLVGQVGGEQQSYRGQTQPMYGLMQQVLTQSINCPHSNCPICAKEQEERERERKQLSEQAEIKRVAYKARCAEYIANFRKVRV